MNIDQLKYIITIASTGSFSRTAEILFISQPALSQYVKRLEESLGVQLFERSRTRVNLTEAGQAFVERAQEILKLSEELEETMQSYSEISRSTFSFGISQFYGKFFLPKTLGALKKNPDLIIEIKENESRILESQLLAGKIDFAIIPPPIESPEIIKQTIYEEKILLAINKNNSLNNKIKEAKLTELDFLNNQPLILLKKGFKLRELVDALLEEEEIKGQVILETENLDTLNSLVAQDIGISFLPDVIEKLEGVLYYELTLPMSTRPIILAYREHRAFGSRRFREIIKTIKQIDFKEP